MQIYEPEPGDDPVPPEGPEGSDTGEGEDQPDNGVIVDPKIPGTGGEEGGKRFKYFVNDVPVSVINERVQYYGPDGKLITESLRDYTKKNILREFASLDNFLTRWKEAEKKQVIIDELQEKGIFFDALEEEVGKELDPFDLICHVAFGQKPLTRRERALNVRKQNYFTEYGETSRTVLNALLDKYADEGIQNVERLDILKITPFDRFGSPVEIIKSFGGKEKYTSALRKLEAHLYAAS